MPLTGLDIFKLLPKTNCGDCSKATCLAFAVQLAAKKASLDECPHASDAAREALGKDSTPPMKTVTIGTGDSARTIGGETVMFRHEEKFHHPTVIAIRVTDDVEPVALASRLEAIVSLQFERVGQRLAVDAVAVDNVSGKADTFASVAKAVANCVPQALILVGESPNAMKAAVGAVAARRPLICSATAANCAAMADVAKAAGCPVSVKAENLESLAALAEQLARAGVNELVLDASSRDHKGVLHNLTLMRRAALRKSFRPFGYPSIAFASAADPSDEVARASTWLAKYASIIVLNACKPWQLLPLLTERQNIYADPQKPMQVEQRLYAAGDPDEDAPLLITTNFSLTFFIVQADVESSRVPAWILPVDTEGTSVLTAYSGDKFNEKIIAAAMQKVGVAEKLRHRTMIIPGYVASLSGKLEEATGWRVLVGPKESAHLPKFLQTYCREQFSAISS